MKKHDHINAVRYEFGILAKSIKINRGRKQALNRLHNAVIDKYSNDNDSFLEGTFDNFTNDCVTIHEEMYELCNAIHLELGSELFWISEIDKNIRK